MKKEIKITINETDFENAFDRKPRSERELKVFLDICEDYAEAELSAMDWDYIYSESKKEAQKEMRGTKW